MKNKEVPSWSIVELLFFFALSNLQWETVWISFGKKSVKRVYIVSYMSLHYGNTCFHTLTSTLQQVVFGGWWVSNGSQGTHPGSTERQWPPTPTGLQPAGALRCIKTSKKTGISSAVGMGIPGGFWAQHHLFVVFLPCLVAAPRGFPLIPTWWTKSKKREVSSFPSSQRKNHPNRKASYKGPNKNGKHHQTQGSKHLLLLETSPKIGC